MTDTKRVAIATLGCKTNQFESAAIAEQFARAGYRIVSPGEPADIYVVNSCTVTARTDSETRKLIRRARRLNPQARIVATGCYAQVSPEELSQMPEVDVVLGNIEKLDPLLVAESPEDRIAEAESEAGLSPLRLTSFAEHTRAFLQVQNGCNTFCAYCIVPFARGRSRSVPVGEVVESIGRLAANGFKEVVLTGIHLGAYGLDLAPPCSLQELIEEILRQKRLQRLRIGSVDPNEFGDSLLELCRRSPEICRHFHIPLQSGSDGVLARMGRPYDAAAYRLLLDKIDNAMPDAFIGTDLIAGFPGETEAEFAETCRLIESLPLADLHVFPYSRRPRTRAATMPGQVPPAVIKERAAHLRALAALKKEQFLRQAIGSDLQVLVQGWDEAGGICSGVARNYVTVRFAGEKSLVNSEQRVRISGVAGDQLTGELLRD